MSTTSVQLTKHHGLGNDFLIALDPPLELTGSHAKQWCDRRTGIGADGLIVARSRPPLEAHTVTQSTETPATETPANVTSWSMTPWSMTLWNADGSRAEISGNGIRCLGQAIGRHHHVSEETSVVIATDAGTRTLTLHPNSGDTWSVRAGMGQAADGPPPSENWTDAGVAISAQEGVDIGNPHLVAVLDKATPFDRVDMAEIGPVIESGYPGGINVHVIRVNDAATIDLKVWERGVGVTQACGSGACAAAWAAHRLGLVGPEITVTMPGGSANVELTESEVFLTGPATYVGSIVLG